MTPVRTQLSNNAWIMVVALSVLGLFTIGITWIALFVIFRSIPSRVDADGVHFWLRRTYALSEIDHTSGVQFVSLRGGDQHDRGRRRRHASG